MRKLQVAITIMTVLIFVGMGLLAYGFATKAGEPLRHEDPPQQQELSLPQGAKIEKMQTWGEGIALHVVAPSGEFIYLVRRSGTVSTIIAVKHAQ